MFCWSQNIFLIINITQRKMSVKKISRMLFNDEAILFTITLWTFIHTAFIQAFEFCSVFVLTRKIRYNWFNTVENIGSQRINK